VNEGVPNDVGPAAEAEYGTERPVLDDVLADGYDVAQLGLFVRKLDCTAVANCVLLEGCVPVFGFGEPHPQRIGFHDCAMNGGNLGIVAVVSGRGETP
jgi:hypothetical protein